MSKDHCSDVGRHIDFVGDIKVPFSDLVLKMIIRVEFVNLNNYCITVTS